MTLSKAHREVLTMIADRTDERMPDPGVMTSGRGRWSCVRFRVHWRTAQAPGCTRGENMSLTDFLLARIAEEEAGIRREGWRLGWYLDDWLLRGCGAKRRIVEVAMPGETDDARTERGRILRILAAAYAAHPDYDPDWQPHDRAARAEEKA